VRAVADTNLIVSAFLWGGTPRKVLDAAETGNLELFTSPALILELGDVLSRPKFAERVAKTRFSAAFLLARYTRLATPIVAEEIDRSVLRDPDDAAVLACALAARAELVVSGDQDLFALRTFREIRIVNATGALAIVKQRR
jgi:putative PIN family toxin of toxin-antitoxin system